MIYMFECGLFVALSIGFRFENIEFLFLIPFLNVFLDFCDGNQIFYSFVKKTLSAFVSGIAGIFFGCLLVYLICLNCNYYTVEHLIEVVKKYSYVI